VSGVFKMSAAALAYGLSADWTARRRISNHELPAEAVPLRG
jgi:hypothetical protein